jgi:hypothetical protein
LLAKHMLTKGSSISHVGAWSCNCRLVRILHHIPTTTSLSTVRKEQRHQTTQPLPQLSPKVFVQCSPEFVHTMLGDAVPKHSAAQKRRKLPLLFLLQCCMGIATPPVFMLSSGHRLCCIHAHSASYLRYHGPNWRLCW